MTSFLSSQRNYPFFNNILTSDKNCFFLSLCSTQDVVYWQGGMSIMYSKVGASWKKKYVGISTLLNSFWVFKLQSDTQCKLIHSIAAACMKILENTLSRRNVMLPHDNAKPHSVRIMQEKLLDLSWIVLSHPPYSPDLVPSDFHLFHSLQWTKKDFLLKIR